jgi:hypothetical protein
VDLREERRCHQQISGGSEQPPCAGRIGCPVCPRVLSEGLQLERQVHADVGVQLQRRLDRIRLLLVRARCNSPP